MPKGIVKCGNCEPWDLFRDGNESLVYSISVGVEVSNSLSSFKSGFYYLLDRFGGSIGQVVSVWKSEGRDWVGGWGALDNGPGSAFEFGDVFIYQDGDLVNGKERYDPLWDYDWYQITIDENSGNTY